MRAKGEWVLALFRESISTFAIQDLERTQFYQFKECWKGIIFRSLAKMMFLRMAWDRKSAATAHSTVMSKRPASHRLVQFESVLLKREYRTNSHISIPRF